MSRKPHQTLGRVAVALLASLVTLFVGGRLSAGTDSEAAADTKKGIESFHLSAGRRLFEKETFGGNGRTCLTWHSQETGTVSPEDAQRRMSRDARDPLFLGDGSDDGAGNGVERMLAMRPCW